MTFKSVGKILGSLLTESDQTRHEKHVQIVMEATVKSNADFKEKALKAGFTEAQAVFMWSFLAKANHCHEYYSHTQGWHLTRTSLI